MKDTFTMAEWAKSLGDLLEDDVALEVRLAAEHEASEACIRAAMRAMWDTDRDAPR